MNLIDQLQANCHHFEFSQILRVMKAAENITQSPFSLSFISEALPSDDLVEVKKLDCDDNHISVTAALEGLSGVNGVIPDYINNEILNGIFEDDYALFDFMNVFNHKVFDLHHRCDLNHWLLTRQEESDELTHFLNSIACSLEDDRLSRFSFIVNQGGTSSLDVINQVINDVFKYEIIVKPQFAKRHVLSKDSISRLGNKEHYNSRLGEGLLLGNTCKMYFGQLNVFIKPHNIDEFNEINHSDEILTQLTHCLNYLLNENKVIAVFMLVKRAYLSAPRLTSDLNKTLRLGEVDYFPKSNSHNEVVSIQLG